MSDLISRSALLARYDRIHVGAPGAARKMIEDAPTIDAVPVDKIHFTDLYLDGSEAIAVFKFGNQGITLRKKCDELAPVVRCKDCMHSRPIDREDSYEAFFGEDCVWCTENDVGMHNHGFCSKGERKENAENH